MNIEKTLMSLCLILRMTTASIGQIHESWKTLKLGKQSFELLNVTGEIIKFQGEKVLKIERDLVALPFDAKNLEATVDEPHYSKLLDLDDFENGGALSYQVKPIKIGIFPAQNYSTLFV